MIKRLARWLIRKLSPWAFAKESGRYRMQWATLCDSTSWDVPDIRSIDIQDLRPGMVVDGLGVVLTEPVRDDDGMYRFDVQAGQYLVTEDGIFLDGDRLSLRPSVDAKQFFKAWEDGE